MLTVKDLIEKLQTMPADSVVYINGSSDFATHDAPLEKRVDIIAEPEEIDPMEWDNFFSSIIPDNGDLLDSYFINKAF